jgi:urease accessory protein
VTPPQDPRLLGPLTTVGLARLLQLSSQILPIGGYSHSQGLESAIEQRTVTDAESLSRWMSDILEFSMMSCEIPWLESLHGAWLADDSAGIASLNEGFLATRESAELRAACVQMGYSLRSLLYTLPGVAPRIVEALRTIDEPSLPCAWSAAATVWQLTAEHTAMGYLWSWAENQVLVAMKAIPLGQSAAQGVLVHMGETLARLVAAGIGRAPESRSNFAPALAILSSQHESQYSRLFRS